MPRQAIHGEFLWIRYRSRAAFHATPNLCSCAPVAMCGWPPASTSGFTRMAAAGRVAPAGHKACGFAQQNFQFRAGFDVEHQDAAVPRGFRRIAQRFADFLPRFPHAGKNDAIAGNSDAAQPVEFAARDDVETAAQPRQNFQHGKIRVRLHCIAQRVRQRTKGSVKSSIGRLDARATVNVGGRPNRLSDARQRNAFAIKRARAFSRRPVGELRRVCGRIDDARRFVFGSHHHSCAVRSRRLGKIIAHHHTNTAAKSINPKSQVPRTPSAGSNSSQKDGTK